MTAEGCGKGSLNFKFSLVPVSGDSPCVSNSEASSRLCPMWFAREKPRKAARSIEHCRQPRAFGGLVLQFSISKNRRVLWRGQGGQHCKPPKMLVGISHISHGRSRPRERKAATDAVVGPVVFKTARKLYRVMEVKKFSE